MRILVVGLEGATPEGLLGQEDLPNVRRLMEAGCFGGLECAAGSAPAWDDLAAVASLSGGEGGAVLIGVPLAAVPERPGTILVACPVRSADGRETVTSSDAAPPELERGPGRFDALRHHLARGDAGALVLVDRQAVLSGDAARAADDEIGKVLETIEGETAVLVVALPGAGDASAGAFVLAAPGVPPAGAVDGARFADLAPTLLALGGREIPADLPGRSLVGDAAAAPAATDEDEERLVKERLAGLGYI